MGFGLRCFWGFLCAEMRMTFVSKSCGILVGVVRRIIVVESIDRSIVVVVGRGCGRAMRGEELVCWRGRLPCSYPVRVVGNL